jgi:hypothetical protein
VKNTKPKKDPRRSAAAREAWKKRRKRRKNGAKETVYGPGPVMVALQLASKLTHEELGGFMTAVAMIQQLPVASRKLVLDTLAKVFP